MHQMLSVGNLSWNIAIPYSFLTPFHIEKDFSPEQLVTIKLRNKGPRGWVN